MADELARQGALLAPSVIPCSVSPLISRIHYSLFSHWRSTVSSKFFDIQVSSISIEELVLSRHARCVLSHLRCNGHSLLLSSYLFRFGRIENPSCSACGHSSQDTSHLILHCPASDSLRRSLFGDSLSLSTTSGPGLGELPGFWGSMVFHHPSLERGRVTTTTAAAKIKQNSIEVFSKKKFSKKLQHYFASFEKISVFLLKFCFSRSRLDCHFYHCFSKEAWRICEAKD